MEIEIKISIKAGKDSDLYNMDLKIPTSGIDKDNPFKFIATVRTTKGLTEKIDDVLKVIYIDKDNFLVGVAPPKSMLAGLEDYVDSLAVLVSQGTVNENIENTRIVELTEPLIADTQQLPEALIVDALATNTATKPETTKKRKASKK